MSCGTASTVDETSPSEFRTYWFEDYKATVASIKNETPLDLWDAANDGNKITDYYYGLT